ncbi:MAG: DUF6036 family nucleotidyltransferase [Candidatus Aenigmatarchaeota archaeon]
MKIDGPNEGPFFLHFSRSSKKYLKAHEDRIKNEFDHLEEKKAPETSQYVYVVSPEDIILSKLPRSLKKDLYDIALLIRCEDLDLSYLKDSANLWYPEDKFSEMLDLFNRLYSKYKL